MPRAAYDDRGYGKARSCLTMDSVSGRDRFLGVELSTLPAFEKYDLIEFDTWLQALVEALTKNSEGKWWEADSHDFIINGLSERAEAIRQRLASGDVRLCSMPPPGKMPRYAGSLLQYLDPTPPAPTMPNTEAGRGNGYRVTSPPPVAPPRAEPTVLCVPSVSTSPIQPLPEIIDIASRPGRPSKPRDEVLREILEVLTLEAQGRSDAEIAREIDKDEKTVRLRRKRYHDLHSRAKTTDR
jgi:hypothetical protein